MNHDLTRRLMAYRDSLGNPDSRALIADALDELSRLQWRLSAHHEALKGLRDATPGTATLKAARVRADEVIAKLEPAR